MYLQTNGFARLIMMGFKPLNYWPQNEAIDPIRHSLYLERVCPWRSVVEFAIARRVPHYAAVSVCGLDEPSTEVENFGLARPCQQDHHTQWPSLVGTLYRPRKYRIVDLPYGFFCPSDSTPILVELFQSVYNERKIVSVPLWQHLSSQFVKAN